MLKRALVSNISAPWKLTGNILKAAPTLYRATEGLLNGKGDDKISVPNTRFNVPVSPHKNFDAVAFDFHALKAIRKAVDGAKVNDVVLAIVSGGLRRYLMAHEELPDEPLVAMVPMNTREKGAAVDTDAPGNNITALTIAIYTNIDDTLERLRAITLATQQAKSAKSGLTARLAADLTQHIPAASQTAIARLLLKAMQSKPLGNLFISNVGGLEGESTFLGAKVAHNFGLAPLADGMGLFIATPSYGDYMSFNVISTPEIIPDIEYFITCLQDSFDELQKAVAAPKKKAKARKK
jgi:WS/DGAT/MGAT family acyltransferase